MPQTYLKKKKNWPPKVIGLTGVIASGKSTVARLISRMGIAVLDTDMLAREAVKPGAPALKRLVDSIGTGIIGPDGGLDRAQLLELMLSDARIKQVVEDIMHPEIFRLMDERLKTLKETGADLVFVETPLLFEAGWEGLFDMIVTVSAPDATCIERLAERNDMERQKARKWLKQQLPQEEKARRANYVIFNDSLNSLQDQVARLIANINGIK
ncbi:MAG: dephospho-CoA kinase [Dissulfurimicrobium sp.]|uniref:dephospho-CoA kinase n=1 Tax=Dissulfurimicrobium sp. TaxID=2022436 RepID=UPI004049C745